jgi:zinc transporter ZupT
MGKSRRKLFISATISGIALSLGLPGLANLISLVWETTREPIEQILPSDLRFVISFAGLLVFGVITYLNWEIYLKGAKKGKKGIITVLAGVVLGLVIGSVILAFLVDSFGV